MKNIAIVGTLALLGGMAVSTARADILVGIGTATTGAVAALGEQSVIGAHQAIDDINAKGGVLGQKLQLKVGDDACDPKQAVAVANQFVADKVVAVDGHLCSGAAIPAADIYHEEEIVMVTPTATNPKLTEHGYDSIFRVCGRDDQQGVVSGSYLASHFKGKNIAIVDDKQAYGAGLADVVAATLEKAGIKIVYRGAVTPGEKDFRTLIGRLKEDKVDAVYYGGYHPELGLIIRQAREQGLTSQFVAGDGLNNAEFWSITGTAGQGTLYTDSSSAAQNPAAQVVTDEFTKGGHADAGNFAYYSYAAVQVIAQGLAKAGAADSVKLAAALHAGSFDTIVGNIQFDKKGDVVKPSYVLYEWRDGKNVPVSGQ
ncbi:MAG: branched-chain amino acid ABC transporter substrate-binding protein [Azospirillaceae bacterium]|nr:branched-chain amino acid ABC transporter substrate-binding protein [Azospirillaceae bacterium]